MQMGTYATRLRHSRIIVTALIWIKPAKDTVAA